MVEQFMPSDGDVVALCDALRSSGAVTGAIDPAGLFARWLAAAARRGVSAGVVGEVVAALELGPTSFDDVLGDSRRLLDPHGSSYFVLARDVDADMARRATLLTMVLAAGTDYGTDATGRRVTTDFAPTPFSSAEVSRVVRRQRDNAWSYREGVGFVHRRGGRLVTTPYGILVGLGGDPLLRVLSQRGGTTWGDVFLLNAGRQADPVGLLRDVVASGVAPRRGVVGRPGALSWDRLLHHEERHSRQWAREGPTRFVASYLWEQVRRDDRTEREAGLADGGYR